MDFRKAIIVEKEMSMFVFKLRRRTCRLSWLIIILVVFLHVAVAAFAAELLPFPTPNRATQYQQVVPQSRASQTEQKIRRFKRDIRTSSCAELKRMQATLQREYETAGTTEDKNYYSRFLNALNQQMRSSQCR
ncbi:hypothetical protein [Desulfogranum marinum]|uniref:hypothetical protein n=2 Tax=Desulfogranum marinum TaxID=453220 RepID=UPI001965083F|nr:hypothetical protein [Desulfogranum marinum]MBM9512843.1 hypothetical protein [Desulfogranum marinum]